MPLYPDSTRSYQIGNAFAEMLPNSTSCKCLSELRHDSEDQRTARRAPHARNTASTIKPFQSMSPPQLLTNAREGRPDMRQLARLDLTLNRIRWEEEEVVAHARNSATEHLLRNRKSSDLCDRPVLLLSESGLEVRSGGLIAAKPGGTTTCFAEEGTELTAPEAGQAFAAEDLPNDGKG